MKNWVFQNVHTYIQSGNVIFEASEKQESLSVLISEEILKKYGWEVPVLVKTPSEIKNILGNCPFPDEIKQKSYFVLLQSKPLAENISINKTISYPNEAFIITNSCVYLYSKQGIGKTKLSTNFFECKLKVNATARNYRTMAKLLELVFSF